MKIRASKIYQLINDTAVFAYKAAGTPILIVLMLWTISYLSLTGFYLASDRWIVPFVAGPGQERVVRESSAYSDNMRLMQRLKDDRAALVAQLENAKEVSALSQKQFQLSLTAFIQEDASDFDTIRRGQANLDRTKNLLSLRRLLREKYEQRLITSEQMERELASLSSQELTIQRKPAQISNPALHPVIEGYRRDQDREKLLTNLMRRNLSTGTSRLLGDLLNVQAELRRSQSNTDLITSQIKRIDEQLNYYAPIVKNLARSPFVQAGLGPVNMAFLPYQNITHGEKGSDVYGCKLYFLVCKKVATIEEIYTGDETTWQHPFFNSPLRGTLVLLKVTDPKEIQRVVLMVGRPPLGL